MGAVVSCVDIESIDADDPEYAPVIGAFNTYSLWALPIITLNGAVASAGESRPERVTAALRQAMPAELNSQN